MTEIDLYARFSDFANRQSQDGDVLLAVRLMRDEFIITARELDLCGTNWDNFGLLLGIIEELIEYGLEEDELVEEIMNRI